VSWSGPTPISSPSWDLGSQDLALNEAGEGVIAWRAADRPEDYSSGVIRASVRTRDGSWESPLNLGYAGSQIEEPKTAVDGRGNALVLWARNGLMFAAYRSASGWQPTTSFATGIGWENYDVVMNRRGDALAVWGDQDGQMISARRPAATGSWSSPVRVPVTSPLQGLGASFGLSFALDEQGNAILVEGRDDGQVEALTLRSSDEQWQAPAVLGTSGGTSAWYAHDNWCVRPRVAVDAAGGTLVVWGGSSLYAVRRPAGSNGWQKPVVVTADHACWGRAVAVDEAGDGVVLFNSGENARRLDAAILDVTPPLIDMLRAPATARAGRPIRIALAARDGWSPVTAVEWRFGDGARAHGRGRRTGEQTVAAVTHRWRRPGRYTVTVTVSDQAWNSARRTLRVRVR
jgi:PKD domain